MKTEYIYLLFWTILNILTAGLTELYPDEAYYWMYSEFLEWGYFDHPPMVALMIKSTSFLGQNEIAVRLPSIILLSITLWLTYKLANVNVHLFFLSVFSIFSLNILGFLILPDIPFLFFGVLFLYFYKRYLQSQTISLAILLGIIGALLLYSKYHGILIIGITLLSNLKLLKDWKTYVIGFIILFLITPHIYWQYENGFPSYFYHMVERSAREYKFSYTLTYLTTNLLFHGPLVGLVLIYFSLKRNSKNLFEKALKWNLIGTLLFFFLSSFKGHVEPNWTIFIIIPLLILGLPEITQNNKALAFHRNISITLIVILAVFRFHLINPLFVFEKDRVWEFHGNKDFVNRVLSMANGKNIVANRYQEASILSFYHPKKHHYIPSLNVRSRSNQFNIWMLDSILETENVYFVNNHMRAGMELIALKKKVRQLNEIDSLPRVTGYKLTSEVISFDSNQLVYKINLERPENEKLKSDKMDLSIHIKNDKSTRYKGHNFIKNGDTVRLNLEPGENQIVTYLNSNKLEGDIKAYDKIIL